VPSTCENFAPGDGSILPEHRAQRVAAVSGKRARRYLQRQHLLDLGPAALAYLTELTHRRPTLWIHDVERLHDLLQAHGDAALRCAFERGLAEQAIGAEYIAHYLDASTPGLPFDPDADRPPMIAATPPPRGGRVQVADGARRGGAQRSTWTRPSTYVAIIGDEFLGGTVVTLNVDEQDAAKLLAMSAEDPPVLLVAARIDSVAPMVLTLEPCRDPDCDDVALEIRRFDSAHRIIGNAIAIQPEALN